MDLYDDLDTKQRAGQIDGWSSGIKLMQTQMALKKAVIPTPARKDFLKRSTVSQDSLEICSQKSHSPMLGTRSSDAAKISKRQRCRRHLPLGRCNQAKNTNHFYATSCDAIQQSLQ